MSRHLRGPARTWVACALAAAAGVAWAARGAAGADPPDPAAAARDALAARGLRPSGGHYVLPAEERLQSRLDAMERLVGQNQAALRRRALRSVIAGRSQSLLADLQAWQLALNAADPANFGTPPPFASPFGIDTPSPLGTGRTGMEEIADLNRQQITGMFNVVAGVQADDAVEAVEALARQDDFDRERASVRRAIEALDREYRALKADPEVPAALGVLTRAENRPIALGPAADFEGRLAALERGMDATRSLTTRPGAVAPDYGVAAGLVQGARVHFRLALGRLRESARDPAADPARGVALRDELARRRDRYVRSVALLRRAYDAYVPPPPIRVRTVEPIPEPAEPGKIRALVRERQAGLRAEFVAEAERSLRTGRVPLRRDGGALRAEVSVNGAPPRPMRIEPEAPEVLISKEFADAVGVAPDPATGLGVLRAMKLGIFDLRDVPCRVVPGDEATAPAVLGAPVLAWFTTEVDESGPEPTLSLTRVELPPIAPRPRPPGAPPAKAKAAR